MNLRQFCSLFDQNTLMDVLIGTLSTGVYSIKEILYDGKFNSNLLDSPIKEGTVTIMYDNADNLIANDSKLRNEFFSKDALLPYVTVTMK